MSSDGPQQKKQRTNSGGAGPSGTTATPAMTRGMIARIKLHNFMTHNDVEIENPGQRLNCIVGPNGTGKSSIVCAMCVGLGGPLKITGRGDSISACVLGEGNTMGPDGQPITSGFVETELVDGVAPGKNLTVRVDFNVKNQEKWQLKKGDEKWQQAKKGEVKEAMAKLNIQVDNPLQFLPQDKVGEFSNMSPVRLLEHTEMAIGPETYEKHLRLIDDDKEMVTVKQRLATEKKALADLEAVNQKLEMEVETFRRLQENKKKLDAYRGKVLWVEADYLKGRVEEAKGELDTAEASLKRIKEEVRKREATRQPLEEAVKEFGKEIKKYNDESRQHDEKRCKLGDSLGKLTDDQDTEIAKIESADKTKAKKWQAVEKAQAQVDENQKKLDKAKADLAVNAGRNPEEVKAEIEGKLRQATQAHRQAINDLQEHKGNRAEVERAAQRAKQDLANFGDPLKRKMQLVAGKQREAAIAASWLQEQAPENVRGKVLGPLLCHIDVPDQEHQKLVEEAIGFKFAISGFVALNDSARNAMTQKLNSEGWRLNVYKNSEGQFRPCQRPGSNSMKKWGVTAWLDEALQIADHERDAILCSLRDLMQVDKFLLATAKTTNCIEALQKYLADQGMTSVTILTPERVYRVVKSRYGEQLTNATTQAPKPVNGFYKHTYDESRKASLEQARDEADQAYNEYLMAEKDLTSAEKAAADAKGEAQQELTSFNTGKQNLASLERRMTTFTQRLKEEKEQYENMDVEKTREEHKKKLLDLAKKESDIHAKIVDETVRIGELREKELGALLGRAAAKHRLDEANAQVSELTNELEERKRDKKAANEKMEGAMGEYKAKAAEAKKAAAHLEPGKRDAAADREWDAMKGDLDELQQQITDLEEEIDAADDDGGKALRDYEQRLKDIEAGKSRVDETESEVEQKQTDLDKLTAEWKPELNRLISVVNDNFAEYFRRFKCCGEVSLADGRKLNPMTGEPEGADDFSQYKILIKVQWRATEELHVLGEGGRDSGGERSVATMVYLISLQNINPAPFRVVDEINLAMDSTNERNVFQCITHACNQGGKQYFLLTPKLLPDLDYGHETSIQLVLNGPYNLPGQGARRMVLSDWV